MSDSPRIPRFPDDYTREAASGRRDFISDQTGVSTEHLGHYSLDPAVLPGNIEHFVGVVQMPVGLAGPLRINGEHAQGDFYVPMATTEGTLVASYNRGMRALTESGGVKTTVVHQFMQRSPVFHFDDARAARRFDAWLDEVFDDVREAAESTTRIGKLTHIQRWPVGRSLYLRCNYTTGDAAGQNMVSKATYVACEWLRQHAPVPCRYLLSGNIDTDKKHSQMNLLHTRGRRVVAEAVLKRDVVRRLLHVETAQLATARHISNVGAFMAGAANNGPHAANGIAALFIATGQDEANVVESHTGIVYSELLDDGDYWFSVTLPSLIVATRGGGTGLPTQRECLEMLGCYGDGKADKLAEIVAATVLAGDLSLGAAVLAGDWVTSHERLGRNRP
ncbi:MAG: hydroxymethylglutaryl-CoA reductase [Pseudomonadota bacterium]